MSDIKSCSSTIVEVQKTAGCDQITSWGQCHEQFCCEITGLNFHIQLWFMTWIDHDITILSVAVSSVARYRNGLAISAISLFKQTPKLYWSFKIYNNHLHKTCYSLGVTSWVSSQNGKLPPPLLTQEVLRDIIKSLKRKLSHCWKERKKKKAQQGTEIK